MCPGERRASRRLMDYFFSPPPSVAEPGTGLLQGRQQILPHRAGQAGGPRRVSPHRHVHHTGEEPLLYLFCIFPKDAVRGAASLGTESIILAGGRAAVRCHAANRAVCSMCSQVCALQLLQPHTLMLFTAAGVLKCHRRAVNYPVFALSESSLLWFMVFTSPAGCSTSWNRLAGNLMHLPHCCLDPQPDKEGVANTFLASGS